MKKTCFKTVFDYKHKPKLSLGLLLDFINKFKDFTVKKDLNTAKSILFLYQPV